jgi:hypothetical protein
MKKFIETKEKGTLYLDRVLFETNIPILFICKNDKDELFICVCCQMNEEGQRWLISSITEETIIKMLKDRITIREAFLMDPSYRISAIWKNNKLIIERDNNDWNNNSIYLPKKDAFIEAVDEEFDDDIDYYSSKSIRNSYNDQYDELESGSQAVLVSNGSIDLNDTLIPEYGDVVNSVITTVIETLSDIIIKQVNDTIHYSAYSSYIQSICVDRTDEQIIVSTEDDRFLQAA